MASYLEAYGAGEEQHARRSRLIKQIAIALVLVLIVGVTLYSLLKNRSEEQQVKTFVDRLKSKDYQAAYAMFGCTAATPCRDYSLKSFMDDFGPGSPHANAESAEVGSSDSCGTGVVIPVDFKGSETVPLWVDRGARIIGFSPDPECRKKRWHLKEFFQSFRH